jgi:hypothetical protein
MAPHLTAADIRPDQRTAVPRQTPKQPGSAPAPQSRIPVASDGLETLRSSHC